jgi:hypothetical protein
MLSWLGQGQFDYPKKAECFDSEAGTKIFTYYIDAFSLWGCPQVADCGTLSRYGGYWGNKIPSVDLKTDLRRATRR